MNKHGMPQNPLSTETLKQGLQNQIGAKRAAALNEAEMEEKEAQIPSDIAMQLKVVQTEAGPSVAVNMNLQLITDAGFGGFMLAVAAQAIAAGVNKSDPGYEFNECLKDVVGAFEDTISSHAKARLEMADRDADQTDKEENPILDGKGNVVDFPGKDDNGGGEPLAEG